MRSWMTRKDGESGHLLHPANHSQSSTRNLVAIPNSVDPRGMVPKSGNSLDTLIQLVMG